MPNEVNQATMKQLAEWLVESGYAEGVGAYDKRYNRHKCAEVACE